MPLPERRRQPLEPGPAVLPGRRADRARHPRRPARARRPDRQRGRPRRPARALPPDAAPGHPDARRQGHAGPQARGRHPGRQRPDPAHRRADQPLRRPHPQRAPAHDHRPRAWSSSPPTSGPQKLNLPAAHGSGGCDRLRTVKDEPLALMCNLVPERVTDLSRVDLDHTGLYEHFRAQAINLRVAHQVIGARTVDAAEAHLLGGRKGDPVLTMERTSYDDKGRAVEHGHAPLPAGPLRLRDHAGRPLTASDRPDLDELRPGRVRGDGAPRPARRRARPAAPRAAVRRGDLGLDHQGPRRRSPRPVRTFTSMTGYVDGSLTDPEGATPCWPRPSARSRPRACSATPNLNLHGTGLDGDGPARPPGRDRHRRDVAGRGRDPGPDRRARPAGGRGVLRWRT